MNHFLKIITFFLILPGFGNPVFAQSFPAGDTLYYTSGDTDAIRKVQLDGSSEEVIADLSEDPFGVAIDLVNEKIYFSETTVIKRSDLDGSNVETIITGQGFVWEMAVDPAGGKLYWADNGDRIYRRSNLDGSNVEDLVSSSAAPIGVALDLVNGKLYMGDQGSVTRSNLDGSSQEVVIFNTAQWLAVDSAGGRIFYVNSSSTLRRVNFDGTNDTLIFNGGTDLLRGIAIKTDESKIYFTNQTSSTLRRIDLDGLGEEEVTSLPFPANGFSLFFDGDSDGAEDSVDECLEDSGKAVAGSCGCGRNDSDLNSDGTIDCLEIDAIQERLDELTPRSKKMEIEAFFKQTSGIARLITALIQTVSEDTAATLRITNRSVRRARTRLLWITKRQQKRNLSKGRRLRIARGIQNRLTERFNQVEEILHN